MTEPSTALNRDPLRRLLILLPGNPAIPGIYDSFTAACRAQLSGLETTVLAHCGLSDESGAVESKHCLEQVLAEHEKNILALIAERRPQCVYLVGHSLGTAVAVALYDALAPHIDRLVLICPFLQPRGRNRLLLRLLSNDHFNRGFRRALRGLLRAERAALPLLRDRFNLGETAGRVHSALTRGHFLDNFLGLTSDYLRFFGQHRPLDALDRLPLQHTLFISAPCDFWVPDALLDDLPAGARHRRLPDIEHGFCLHPKQCRAVAQASAAFLLAQDNGGYRKDGIL